MIRHVHYEACFVGKQPVCNLPEYFLVVIEFYTTNPKLNEKKPLKRTAYILQIVINGTLEIKFQTAFKWNLSRKESENKSTVLFSALLKILQTCPSRLLICLQIILLV